MQILIPIKRSGRAVDGDALEKHFTREGNGGSNPSSSAITFYDEGTQLGTGSKGEMHIEYYCVLFQ